MADFTDDGESEEDLRSLEDDKVVEGPGAEEESRPREQPRERGNRNLPSPLYRIKASHSNETYFAYFEGGEPSPEPLAPRTQVLAPTRYGRDICELQGLVKEPGRIASDELLKIERVATEDDLSKAEANKEKERKAFELCREKIETHKLPMKLVAAHYLLEEPKVIFFFSAESRVDFRELVKDLVSVFKMRIELRQIGVRDEARITGGCGVCGRVLCCHGVTDKLTPVSIKMAKDQNLSLNSMKISGPCGRLLCCLAYEFGFYRDARRELPGEGARFVFEDVQFRVVEVNALAGSVKASGEDGRVLEMPASRFVHSEGRWQVRPEAEPKKPE
jgi:cell fate regulator YaaT (PSP1 superfamily)